MVLEAEQHSPMCLCVVLASVIPPSLSVFLFVRSHAEGRSEAPRNGWHGEYRTGDLIFLPGNSLHHVRNKCANTVAINVRPWLHSIARKAASLHGLPIPFSTRDSRARYCYCSSATHARQPCTSRLLFRNPPKLEA